MKQYNSNGEYVNPVNGLTFIRILSESVFILFVMMKNERSMKK